MKGDLNNETSGMDRQTYHLGNLPEARRNLRRDRHDHDRNFLRRTSGARLVEGNEGLYAEVLQEVNLRIRRSIKGRSRKTTALSLFIYIFRIQVTEINAKIVF